MDNFPDCRLTKELSLSQMFERIFYKTGECFIFVIDEWDGFFHSDFYSEEGAKEYLTFLKNLLKDKPYVELAYMTGVLPIKKYSISSELNMFDEFYFPTDTIYDTFFGFTEEKVKDLCERNKKEWWHGPI